MGTWGAGNFENDGAADYVGKLVVHLEQTIEACFADEYRSWLDGDGEAVLMPSVDLLALICEHRPVLPPSGATVERWRDRYLALFDEQIEGLEPEPGFKDERRQKIEETFAALLASARRWHES